MVNIFIVLTASPSLVHHLCTVLIYAVPDSIQFLETSHTYTRLLVSSAYPYAYRYTPQWFSFLGAHLLYGKKVMGKYEKDVLRKRGVIEIIPFKQTIRITLVRVQFQQRVMPN